jgi:hypothetical protein
MQVPSNIRPLRVALFASLLAGVCLLCAALAQASSGSALPKLSLSLTDSTITVRGSTQSGAVNVVSTYSGKKEAAAVLFRLNPGVTSAEAEALLKSKKLQKDINTTSEVGAIVFDAEVHPGQVSEAQTTLAPGQYLALNAGGQGSPKVYSSFTVTASSSPVELPKPQATIRSIEFGFKGPGTLHDGELVAFKNEGWLVHMDLAFPVASQAAAKQVITALKTGNQKGLGKLIVGEPVSFSGPVSHGALQQETITAKPGWYVQVCFMETQEGVPHTLLGMERAIKITK